MKNQIKLFLYEQSDLVMACLPIPNCPKIFHGKKIPLPLIQEQVVISAKEWAHNMGRLAQEQSCLVTECPEMTSAIYRGRKATNKTTTKKQQLRIIVVDFAFEINTYKSLEDMFYYYNY